MWMPQQIPAVGEELKKLGLRWIRISSPVSLFPMGATSPSGAGCSASFVSPGRSAGDHTIVSPRAAVQLHEQNDILLNGFLARERARRFRPRRMRECCHHRLEDVTKQILAAFPAGTTDADRYAHHHAPPARDNQSMREAGQSALPGGVVLRGRAVQKSLRWRSATSASFYAPALGVGTSATRSTTGFVAAPYRRLFVLSRYVGKDGKPADFSKNSPLPPQAPLQDLDTRSRSR